MEDSDEISAIFVSTLLIIIRNLGKRFQLLNGNVLIPFHIQSREKCSLKQVEKIYLNFDVTKMEKIAIKFEQEITGNWNNLEMKNSFLKAMLKKKSIIDVGCLFKYCV